MALSATALELDRRLAAAKRVLRETFGYSEFRPGQATAIQAVLAGRDALAVLPTGGGKSLIYQVPALVLPGLTVVVSPLISLMKDQVDALTRKRAGAAFLNSTLSLNDSLDRLARAATGHVRLVYVAPERLESDALTGRLRTIGVSLFAVDEAHCISQWGHDFRPSYLRLQRARTALGSPTTLALTATATPQVRADIARSLGLRNPARIVTGFDRTNLSYAVETARTEKEKDAIVARVVERERGAVVVYAPTRRSVERLARILCADGQAATAYHAGLPADRRRTVQERFMSGDVRVIVATNAFGMGVDKSDVRTVVHYAMPGTLEAYYQEAGRAGRDGSPASVLLLHSYADRFTHEFFIKTAYPDRQCVERVYAALVRARNGQGIAPNDFAVIAALAGAGVGPRDAQSAIRALTAAGEVATCEASSSLVRVRLLATHGRIRAELGAGAEIEIGILRTMWSSAGDNLYGGATFDLGALPPGFGGAAGAKPILEALAARQFIAWERTGDGLVLDKKARRIEQLDIDWEALETRRRAKLAKLETMQRYAFTKTCRRSYVLRYFGQPTAGLNCRSCDNCA